MNRAVLYLPVALLLMPVVMHAVMLPVAATLWGRLPFEDWLTAQVRIPVNVITESGKVITES